MGIFKQKQTVAPAQDPLAADANAEALPRGAAGAQFALGLQCATATGENRDYAQALQYYLKAAAHHHPLAQHNLGIMYAQAQGVPRDAAESAQWFRVAAERGDTGGQYQFGRVCERAALETSGPHASEYRIEACKWYRLAAAQGYGDAAMSLNQLALRMTRAEADDGRRRAEAFQPLADR